MHLSIEAYGKNRFNSTYDPCSGNITSLCPLNIDTAIEAFGIIPISRTDDAGIPSIALGIPDLEGIARIRIFANSTQTEIGCFQAVLKNGQTFSQPKIVGSMLGAFIFLAALASAATSIYGVQLPHVRIHYAHSFSVLVIFETFQAIYFSGALNLNWPSLLAAWWSNFAWTAGMFASDSMLNGISSFVGVQGNASQAGSAGSVVINNGGGLTEQIYKRSMPLASSLTKESMRIFPRRLEYNASNPYDYNWGGEPSRPGLPTPGDWSGFGGTLSASDIPLKEAFILGLIWFLVAMAFVALCMLAVKPMLNFCINRKFVKPDGFDHFRRHHLSYIWTTIKRTIFIGFFAICTLCMVQFSVGSPAGPVAIAVIVFLLFVSFIGISAYKACQARVRDGKYEVYRDRLRFEAGKIFKAVPFIATTWDSSIGEEEQEHKPRLFGTVPLYRVKFVPRDPERKPVDQDLTFISEWGWLWARYRYTKWWFFTVYIVYQFVRACFIGGGSSSPLAQVFGLFVTDIIAFILFIKTNPFEGARNTTAAIWLSSVSKIMTTGLSIAFLPTFDLDRMSASVLGIIIVVVQAFLGLAILVLILLGIISSLMSCSRNREEFPEKIDDLRVRYFEHIEKRSGTLPSKNMDEAIAELQALAQPYFNPRPAPAAARRPRLEDVDEIQPVDRSSGTNSPLPSANRRSRANSGSSRYSVNSLPRSGRAHRASWNSKDLAEWDADMNRGDQMRLTHVRNSSLRMSAHKIQTTRPMTPTRESAEFFREGNGLLGKEAKEALGLNNISEAGESSKKKEPSKRRSVTFADEKSLTPLSESSGSTTVIPIKEEDKEGNLEAKKNQVDDDDKPMTASSSSTDSSTKVDSIEENEKDGPKTEVKE